jgi:hypothetical protein
LPAPHACRQTHRTAGLLAPSSKEVPTIQDVATTLSELHDEYAEKVNLAVSEGGNDLIQALSDAFTDAELIALLDAGETQTA